MLRLSHVQLSSWVCIERSPVNSGQVIIVLTLGAMLNIVLPHTQSKFYCWYHVCKSLSWCSASHTVYCSVYLSKHICIKTENSLNSPSCTAGWIFASLDLCHRCLIVPQLTMTGTLPLPGSLSPYAWIHWGDLRAILSLKCWNNLPKEIKPARSESSFNSLLKLAFISGTFFSSALGFIAVIFPCLNISCVTFCYQWKF